MNHGFAHHPPLEDEELERVAMSLSVGANVSGVLTANLFRCYILQGKTREEALTQCIEVISAAKCERLPKEE